MNSKAIRFLEVHKAETPSKTPLFWKPKTPFLKSLLPPAKWVNPQTSCNSP